MTKGNGLPCVKCGTSKWNKWGDCYECKRERTRQWKQEHPGKIAEGNRRWQQANQDRKTEASRRWQQNNPERSAEIKRRSKQINRAHYTAKQNQRRTLKTQAGGSYTADEFRALCDHYGNRCLRCKRGDVKLTADHVKPVIKGGSSNIDNIQPLCKSCNSAKHDRHIDYRPDAGPLRWLQCKLFG